MSQENVETVRRGHTAFNTGNLDGLADVVTDDVSWGTSGAFPGLSASYRGPEGVISWASDVRSVWTSFRVSIDEVIFVGPEQAVIVELIEGLGRESGAAVDLRAFSVYAFRDGRIAARQAFFEKSEALDAAGLRE